MNSLCYASIGRAVRQGCPPKLTAPSLCNSAGARRRVSLAGWHRKRRRPNRFSAWNNERRKDSKLGDHPRKDLLIGSASIKRPRRPNAATSRAIGIHNAGQLPDAREAAVVRFLNPWREIADVVPSEEILHDKVDSTTRTFGIVAALMGSLSAALLTRGQQYDGYDANREPIKRPDEIDGVLNKDNEGNNEKNANAQLPFAPSLLTRRNTRNFIEHVTYTKHVSGTSLLVSWGIKESQLDEIYAACCAGSFYTGVLTTVLSSVINAWLAATPPGGVRAFVKLHSWYIVSLPALLAISTSLAGTALFIGLDREQGTPVSYVGLGGSVMGGAAVALVTGTGWLHNYRSLTAAVMRTKQYGRGSSMHHWWG